MLGVISHPSYNFTKTSIDIREWMSSYNQYFA